MSCALAMLNFSMLCSKSVHRKHTFASYSDGCVSRLTELFIKFVDLPYLEDKNSHVIKRLRVLVCLIWRDDPSYFFVENTTSPFHSVATHAPHSCSLKEKGGCKSH